MTVTRKYPETINNGNSNGGRLNDLHKDIPNNSAHNLFPDITSSELTSGVEKIRKEFIKKLTGVLNNGRYGLSFLSPGDDYVRMRLGSDLDTQETASAYGWVEYSLTWGARTITMSGAHDLAVGDVVWIFDPLGDYVGISTVSSVASTTQFDIDTMIDGSDPSTGDTVATFWAGAGEITEALDSSDYTIVAEYDNPDGVYPEAVIAIVDWDNLTNEEPAIEYKTVESRAFSIGVGDIHDDDCSDLTDWVDEDQNGASTQETFQGRETFKFTVATAGAARWAQRVQDVGTIADSFTAEIRLYHTKLGSRANNDSFSLMIDNGTIQLFVMLGTDGLFIYDGAAWNEVGTNIVSQGEWAVWRFVIDGSVGGSETVDIYKNGFLVGSGEDCTYAGASDGDATFRQRGYTINNVLTNVDYLKISDDAPGDSNECYITTPILLGAYAVKTQGVVEGSAAENFDVDGLTLIISVDGGDSETVTFVGDGQTAAQVVAQISVTGATASVHDTNKVKIASDKYYTSGSIQVLSASTGDTELGLDNSIHYGTDGAVIGTMLDMGDIESSHSTPSVVLGGGGSTTWNEGGFPVETFDVGSVSEDITLTFTSATEFDVTSSVGASLPSGDINTDYEPAHWGSYRFKVPSAGWGGAPLSGDTMTFTVYHSAVAVWKKLTVAATTDAYSGDFSKTIFRGQL